MLYALCAPEAGVVLVSAAMSKPLLLRGSEIGLVAGSRSGEAPCAFDLLMVILGLLAAALVERHSG